MLVVSFIGVCISGLAIYYAIQVPKKIANQQNKISLFTKRFEVYQLLNNWIIFIYESFEARGDDDTFNSYLFFVDKFKDMFGDQKVTFKMRINILQDKCNLLFSGINSEIFNSLRELCELLNDIDSDIDSEKEEIIQKWMGKQDMINENLEVMRKQLSVLD